MSAVVTEYHNRLLRTLPEDELEVLAPRLERVTFEPGQCLQFCGRPIEHVFFVESGMVSLIANAGEGEPYEVGSVGWAGMVGIEVLRVDPVAVVDGACQAPTEAMRLGREELLYAFERCPQLRLRVQFLRDLLDATAIQSAVCMAHHELDRRLARWLLMMACAVRSAEFTITQENLAPLLGVCRPTLSVSARALQDAGVISVSRGRVVIVDGDALESMACGCFQALRRHYERFLAFTASQTVGEKSRRARRVACVA